MFVVKAAKAYRWLRWTCVCKTCLFAFWIVFAADRVVFSVDFVSVNGGEVFLWMLGDG